MPNFEIGDTVKIVDSKGASYGNIGDLGEVMENNYDRLGNLTTVRLLTGKNKGQLVCRYSYRYELIIGDWDE